MAEEDKCDEHEKNFYMVFYQMLEMVERMYGDYEKRMNKKVKKNKAHVDDDASIKQGAGGDPLEPPSSTSSSSSSSSEHSHHSHHSSHKASFKKPLLKLDVKFSLPMFIGDANPVKLYNWIWQVEVYWWVQHIDKEEVKVKLTSLQLEDTALIWWESKLQDRSKCGNLLSSWSKFKSTIRKQYYPIGYLHKVMMEWQTLRQSKGQTIQIFTEEFRKKYLALNIPLDSYETLMKYIGTLHIYIRHTFLLFNPTSLDEVCVQATHLENRGKHVQEYPTKKPSNLPHKNFKKFKRKDKKTSTMAREGGKPSCTHCKKSSHDEEQCWKLHPERKSKQFNGKGKTKNIVKVKQYLSYDSGDEGNITTVGVQGKDSLHASSSSNNESHVDERNMNELFHIRVVSKHTKIDTLFDQGSQVNLIFEALFRKMGLEMKPHLKPYPLGWVCDKEKLNVTKQCRIKFSIAWKLIDEVDLDVVPLYICGIVLRSPYLYDRKVVFFRHEKKYHLTKGGVEYIVRAHSMRVNTPLVSAGQMKRHINTNKRYVLMFIREKDVGASDAFQGCDPSHKKELIDIFSKYDDIF
jgi:hypothetical protein